MKDVHTSNRHLLKTGERFLGHTLAVVAGLALMIVGLAMGVTMVLMPVGLAVGLAGLLLCMWGLFVTAPSQPI
jgi:hypothetical protein